MPNPDAGSERAGWLVVQVMVERGLGPEVGYSKYIRVGEAEIPKSRRLTPSRQDTWTTTTRDLVERCPS